ncbi:MAG TPA: DUF1254 domain-containing protein [Terriglobales bacterium]|jgi:hypothetical protein
MRIPFRNVFVIPFAAAALSLVACKQETPASTNEPTNAAKSAATDAYIYGYPLVLADATRAKQTNASRPQAGLAPVNQFVHNQTFPDATFTDVVSPNADTLYSTAWLDLGREPMVLSVPDTHGRYYLMPMLDAWTNVFASPGKRTTGTGKGNFAITGPLWTGTLPAGLKEIKSPTDMMLLAGRTQANGKADFSAVNAIQAQYKLTALSAWVKPYTPPADVATDPKVDMKTPPVDAVAAMDAATFLNRLALLMKNNPPAAEDGPMVAKLASIGVVSGQPFDLNKNGSDAAKAIAEGVEDGKKKVVELGHNPGNANIVNGWMIIVREIGSYGTNYDARAGVAWVGFGANVPDDAIYPLTRVDADGSPLNGANRYVIHFDKGQTPPVNAFWSLTMYNAKQAFVANPINRYAIGDRDKMKFNPDGSLDIYLQHDSPGNAKESNWLPADAGSFNLILRMYWPKAQALSGAWTPPPIHKVS